MNYIYNKHYSCPKVKIPIESIAYSILDDNKVECHLRINRDLSSKYSMLVAIAVNILDMKIARHKQYKWFTDNSDDFGDTVKSSDSFVYLPDCQVYTGTARLKSGDENDIALAKRIAYKKAYRQMLHFYTWCYNNLSKRISAYVDDVFRQQTIQLDNRAVQIETEISDLVKD